MTDFKFDLDYESFSEYSGKNSHNYKGELRIFDDNHVEGIIVIKPTTIYDKASDLEIKGFLKPYCDFHSLDFITFPTRGNQMYFDLIKHDKSLEGIFTGSIETLAHWTSFSKNRDDFIREIKKGYQEACSNITFANPQHLNDVLKNDHRKISYKVKFNLYK